MSINSYKEDEQTIQSGKVRTLLRLLSYLLAYKIEIAFVLLIMMFCVVVSLLNPLVMEEAVDNYIARGDLYGLTRLILFAVVLNLLMIGGIKTHMYIMAKILSLIHI